MAGWKTSLAALAMVTTVGAATVPADPACAGDLMVYVSPDPIGVNPFLKMGRTGIEAAARKHGMEVRTYESRTATDRRENVNAAVDDGARIVVVLGFQFNDIVGEVAAAAPDTQFLIVDQCIDPRPDNVHCAVFREYEASYLVGVAAGMLTTTGTLGVVGAIDIPFLHRYTDGFALGVKSVKPDARVDVRWVGGDNPFADPVRAKEQAIALNAAGADLVYTATSGGDFGVFEAARQRGFKAFAVDVDRCSEVAGIIVDESLKRVDTAIGAAVDAILAGRRHTFESLGIKEGGVGTVALAGAGAGGGCLIASHPEVVQRVRAVAATIADGSLRLADPMTSR